jgi:hypothetical protein
MLVRRVRPVQDAIVVVVRFESVYPVARNVARLSQRGEVTELGPDVVKRVVGVELVGNGGRQLRFVLVAATEYPIQVRAFRRIERLRRGPLRQSNLPHVDRQISAVLIEVVDGRIL